MKEKILISSCLLGTNCKYNGENNLLDKNKIACLKAKFQLIEICPEELGGLSTPREPAEILNGRVITKFSHNDVTENFIQGAKISLKIAKENGCLLAILKARSPSCGSGEIYDGTFSKTTIRGDGICVLLLKQNGIKVITEAKIDKILK